MQETFASPSLKCPLQKIKNLFLLYFDYFEVKIINKYENVVPYRYTYTTSSSDHLELKSTQLIKNNCNGTIDLVTYN